jgi:hypothetical protein
MDPARTTSESHRLDPPGNNGTIVKPGAMCTHHGTRARGGYIRQAEDTCT